MPGWHIPVMLSEVLEYLRCTPGKTIVDGTLGGSGHAAAIVQRLGPQGCLVGIDQDREAVIHARTALADAEANVHLTHGDYVAIAQILSRLGITTVDGILLDLGISYHQIAYSGRGFSFNKDEPLDMRMNSSCGVTAEHLVNELDEMALRDVFQRYGEERWSRKIAVRIVAERKRCPIRTSRQLAEIVLRCVPRSRQRPCFHPATRIFMALRIAVNNELEKLSTFLDSEFDFLRTEGRLCILSFHSLEDRIVKHGFRKSAGQCTCPSDLPYCVCDPKRILKVKTPKGIRPQPGEIKRNPLARSAILRVAEKH